MEDVSLVDQFGPTTVTVYKLEEFCNPVDKNGEGIHDPTAHLTCYKLKDVTPRFERRDVITEDQFGPPSLTVTLKKPERLCVPSEKNGVLSDLNVDHFQCYNADEASGTPRFERVEGVSLEDQFADTTATVYKLEQVCNPVDKNGEGIINEEGHLTCYKLKDVRPKYQRQEVGAEDQFGELTLRVGKPRRLCVPSTKTEIP